MVPTSSLTGRIYLRLTPHAKNCAPRAQNCPPGSKLRTSGSKLPTRLKIAHLRLKIVHLWLKIAHLGLKSSKVRMSGSTVRTSFWNLSRVSFLSIWSKTWASAAYCPSSRERQQLAASLFDLDNTIRSSFLSSVPETHTCHTCIYTALYTQPLSCGSQINCSGNNTYD